MPKNDSGNNRGEALVGTICRYDFTAPTNWLACNGSIVSKTTYADVYSVIGDGDEGTANLTEVTHIHGVVSGREGYSVMWHPSSNYVAMGSNNTDKELAVYSFNGTTLTEVEAVDINSAVYGISWHPNGNFLAATNSTGNDIKIYSWNGTDTLAEVENVDMGYNGRYCDWHPNGNFLVVAHYIGGTDEIIVFSWNGTDTLTSVETLDFAATACTAAWSHNGNYLAVATDVANGQLKVYSWNGTDTLTLVDTYDYAASAWITSLHWSPDDSYIAFGGSSDAKQLVIVSFNGSALAETDNIDYGTTLRASVKFSRGGKYLLVGYYNLGSTLDCVLIYELNYTLGTLTEIDKLSMTRYGCSGIDINYTNNYLAYSNANDFEDTGLLFAGTTALTVCDYSINFILPTITDNIIRAL